MLHRMIRQIKMSSDRLRCVFVERQAAVSNQGDVGSTAAQGKNQFFGRGTLKGKKCAVSVCFCNINIVYTFYLPRNF